LPELLDSTLIGLEKPDNRGLRPIAIGEVWFRLAGLCAMAACPGAGAALAPLQLGVGVKGGSQIIGHALRTGIETDPDCVTLQMDFQNAFNTVSRSAMLAAVAERQPGLLPFAIWGYQQPSRLLVDGAPEGEAPIMSECGVRQGDPCGGLFFSLTTQSTLESIRQAHPDAAPVAYHDDTFLQGSAAAVTAAFPMLRDLSAAIGLIVRPDKCGVYSTNAQAAQATAATLKVPHCHDGLTAAGTPVGTDDFVTAYATKKADVVCKSIDDMLELPLPAQDKFIILRSSMQMRLAHLPRVAPWHLVGDAVQRVEDRSAQATFRIMQRPEQADVRAGQLTLPLRHGGMGIRITSAQEAKASFLSAAAMTETAMREGPEQYRPFAGPNAPSLEQDWQALHAAGEGHSLWPPEALPVNGETIDTVLPSAQRTFARFVAERKSADLLASFDTTTEEGLRNLARMHSCACRPASIWLETLPLAEPLRLTDSDFIGSMRHRLGLTQLPANAPGVRCSCGRHMQAGDTDHAMTCRSLAGIVMLRHNNLVGTWRHIISRAGVASTAEPLLRSLPGFQQSGVVAQDQTRGDILSVLATGVEIADVSVVHPAATTFLQAARVPGGAAAARDQRKRSRYQTADPNGYAFTPLSHESYGRLGKPAMQFLNTLAITASAGGVVRKGDFVANALRELSITLCRGNGAMYRRGLAVLTHASGHAYQPGLRVPTADIS
jgi:hypothetical protein